MKPLSLDLRERIVAAYEGGGVSLEAIGRRFAVSGKVVGKLVRQKRELGTVVSHVHRRGQGIVSADDLAPQRLDRELHHFTPHASN